MHALNPEAIDRLQRAADPSADAIVARIAALGIIGEVNRSLARWDRNDMEPPSDLPDFVRAWLRESAVLPAWVDHAVLARAHQLFRRHGPMIGLVGLTASFAWMYACPHGAQVMAQSGRFGEETSRRIAETIQYIFSVAETGAFTPSGRGICMSVRVRLIHATVRWSLRDRGFEASPGRAAISQIELISTAQSLGPKLIDDVRRLNVTVSADDADAWAHLWRVCGALLGGDRDHLPDGHAAGLAQVNLILEREKGPSEAGKLLIRRLLGFFTDALPGRAFDGIPAAVIRYLLDPERCEFIDVPPSPWEPIFRSGWSGGAWMLGKSLPVLGASAVDRLALSLLEAHFREVDGVPVRLELRSDVRTAFQRGALSLIEAYGEALADGALSEEERAATAALAAQLALSDAQLRRVAVVGAIQAALHDGVIEAGERALIDAFASEAGMTREAREELARAIANGEIDARERAWLHEVLELVG